MRYEARMRERTEELRRSGLLLDDPALLEVCEWLMDQYMGNGLMDYYGTKVSAALCGRFKRVYDPLVLDGWEPSEGAKALRAMCPEKEAEE